MLTLVLSSDKSSVKVGESVLLTCTASSMPEDPIYKNLRVDFTPPAGFSATAATGPPPKPGVQEEAVMSGTYDGAEAPVLSNTLFLEATGQEIPVPETQGSNPMFVLLGDLSPGETVAITVTILRDL